MGWKTMSYKNAREQMKAGDVIAFSGKGEFSEIIKWATRAAVSHVGVVFQTQVIVNGKPIMDMQNQIIESTTLNGKSGVQTNWLSSRATNYPGEVWWLPLRREIQGKMDHGQFFNFLISQVGKEYDLPQAIRSALDAMDDIPILSRITQNSEDFSKFFCSELVAAGLESAGVLKNVNSSEVTPIDLCMFNIFEEDYYQLKGDRKDIRGFNSLEPTGWGE